MTASDKTMWGKTPAIRKSLTASMREVAAACDERALNRAVRAVRATYAERWPIPSASGRQVIEAVIAALAREFRPQ